MFNIFNIIDKYFFLILEGLIVVFIVVKVFSFVFEIITAKKNQGNYSLKLLNTGSNEMGITNFLQTELNMNIQLIKHIYDNMPSTVISCISEKKVYALKSSLENLGALVEITDVTKKIENIKSNEYSNTKMNTCAYEVGDYGLNLISPGSNKINVLKYVREITGYRLKEAMYLVDNAPSQIIEPIISEDCVNSMKNTFENLGATVEITKKQDEI